MNEIDARFEMEIAYYEMCAEETISNLVLTEAEGSSQSTGKKIWSAVKTAVKRIFDSLASALSKIVEKISKLIHGKSLKDDVNELKTAVSSAPKEVQNTEVEMDDIQSMMKINSEARKEVQKLQKDIESGKKVSPDEIDTKMKKYKEDMADAKKKKKKVPLKAAIGGLAVAAYAIPFTINVANHNRSLLNLVCPIAALSFNKTVDKAEKRCGESSESQSSGSPSSNVSTDNTAESSGEVGSAAVKLSNFNAGVAKDAAEISADTAKYTRKFQYVIGPTYKINDTDGNTTYASSLGAEFPDEHYLDGYSYKRLSHTNNAEFRGKPSVASRSVHSDHFANPAVVDKVRQYVSYDKPNWGTKDGD